MIRPLAASLLLMMGCGAPQPPNRIDQIRSFIEAPGNRQSSVLWLRALGVPSLDAPCQSKFDEVLHRQSIPEQDIDCRFTVDGPFADAVLVSRSAYEALPEIRSLLDLEAVEAYVLWSERPERVGFRRAGDEIQIDADAAANDLILVRVPFADGWTTDADASLTRDPIGYTLLAPTAPGRQTFVLRPDSPPPPSVEWTTTRYPRIHPEGIARPGQRHLVIYGRDFTPGLTQATIDGQRITPLYSSESQLNLQYPETITPGLHQLQVETPAGASHPLEIRIEPEPAP